MTVAIIGAGPLGRWLALTAARHGSRVLLEDVMPANLHHARESIRKELGDQQAEGVEFVSTVEDAVRPADLAIDCVPDELESKLEILWLMDRMAPPRMVIATPSLELSIADLAGCTYRPDRCVALALDPRSFLHEPGLKSLGLRVTAQTAPDAIATVRQFWASLGIPVSVETVS